MAYSSPPPLFKQGASARAKVVFFSALAILLLVIDARLHTLVVARKVVATVLYPVQMVAVMPRDALSRMNDYFSSSSTLQTENAKLKRQQTLNATSLQQNAHLLAENDHLRKLLDARANLSVKSLMGEIIYDARDPFSRKIILDKGSNHGVALSQPVIDDLGVVGQVTRVFPLTSEVTLLTDKNHAIPVQILRNGIRSVAYGRGESSYLDMRMTSNADVQKGDVLVTSGIDGIYPAGLSVAKVMQVESKASTPFENILCEPVAGIDRHRQLLVLLVETNNLPRPDTEDVRAKKEKINRRVTRDNNRDAAIEAAQNADKKASDAALSAPASAPVAVPSAAASASAASVPAPAPTSAASKAVTSDKPKAATK
jgi:rod shape-determining protein MreC